MNSVKVIVLLAFIVCALEIVGALPFDVDSDTELLGREKRQACTDRELFPSR